MSTGRYRRLLGRRPTREVDAELRFHFEMRVEEYVAQGMSESAARQLTLERLGDYAGARYDCVAIDRRLQRRETMAAMWETLVQDVRLAARLLARQKLWTILAVLTLAIGIGANSALFSIVNAVLIRPLPYFAPDRIVSITTASGGVDLQGVEEPTYLAWKERTRSFQKLAAFRGTQTILAGSGDPQTVPGRSVTYGYFSIFGVRPLLGRTFTPDEDQPGAARVVILSEQIWRQVYNADSSIINRTILMDDTPATVIGVMPAPFALQGRGRYWTPYRMKLSNDGSVFYTNVMARLADGATIASARADLQAAMPGVPSQLKEVLKDRPPLTPVVMTMHERKYGETRPALLMLFAAVGVLLLIACANVANLLLARATRRQREFAVRAAIGASSWRLVRFTICESVLLSLMGAAVGVAIAAATLGVFVKLSPSAIADAGVTMDRTVLFFTFALAVLTGIAFGLIPAMQIRRVDLNTVLSAGVTRMAGSSRQSVVRRLLVVAEIATALMLVTGAGLLLKSFATVASIDPGIETGHVVVATIDLPRRYKGAAVTSYYDRFTQAVSAIPGVKAVVVADAPPLGGARMSFTTSEAGGRKIPAIDVSRVSDGYFSTMGFRFLSGRPLQKSDESGEPTVVLNETAARIFGDPATLSGSRIPLRGANRPPMYVAGVVRDVLQRGVEEAVKPMEYEPLPTASFDTYSHVIVRTTVPPAAIVTAMRNVARRLDPAMPLPEIATLDERLAKDAAPRKFTFLLVGAFAAIGAILAIIGLYGVMSYVVAERTNEIGVRVALGADARRVMRLVVGEGMTMTAVGVLVGLTGSVVAVRLLRTMLFRVSIYDPSIFTAAAVVLVLTALAACLIPARRAAKLDPVDALRAG